MLVSSEEREGTRGKTMGDNKDRCTVIRLDPEDIERSVQDPALSSLLVDGWTVVSTTIAEEKGKQWFLIILGPPKDEEGTKNNGLIYSIIFVGLAILAHAVHGMVF